MRAGLLRRRLELQRPIETRGLNGEVVTTWAHQAWIWGEFTSYVSGAGPTAQDHVLAGERTALAPRGRVLRIRKRRDVDPKGRIVDGRNTFEIVGIADDDEGSETTLTLKAIETATR